jgi:hypothetical protein
MPASSFRVYSGLGGEERSGKSLCWIWDGFSSFRSLLYPTYHTHLVDTKGAGTCAQIPASPLGAHLALLTCNTPEKNAKS